MFVFCWWCNIICLYKNKVMEQVFKVEQESKMGEFFEIVFYVSGKCGREVFINGDLEYGVWIVGQVIGFINDILICKDLVVRIEKEVEDIFKE